jgi:hypothetical protein
LSPRSCALAAATLALLAGCASVPPPNAAIAQAQSQLQAAQAARAADYDPVDLDFANARFNQAQQAMAARKYALAADLAAESQADGQLAQTKARLAALREQIKAKTADNAKLRAQLLARPAAPAPAPAAAPSGQYELPEQVLPMPAPASSAPSPAMQGGSP